MSPSRPHAPFAARLLAVTLAVPVLLHMLIMWFHWCAYASAKPRSSWVDRTELVGLLALAIDTRSLFALLIACLAVTAALRYRRDVEDRRTRNLALGAAVALGLTGARRAAFELVTAYSGPASTGVSHAEWAAYRHWWYLGSELIPWGALVLVVSMTARTEQAITGRRPTWAVVAGGLVGADLLGSLILGVLDVRHGPFASLGILHFLSWLAPLAVAFGLVIHAGRIRTGEQDAAWGRAAAGLKRYRDAAMLRVLLHAFIIGLFIAFPDIGLSPLVRAGMVGALVFAGILIHLVQVAGLVRVADAPTPPVALAVALPLFGLGLAWECMTLVPIATFVLDGGDSFRRLSIDMDAPALLSLGLGSITTIALLLALRGLAVARKASAVARRCTVVLVTLLATQAAIAATVAWDEIIISLLVIIGVPIVGLYILVSYLQTLTPLHDAMTGRVGPED